MGSLTWSAMAVTVLTAALLCLSVFVTTVSSIKCFQCNSKVDPGCGNLTVGDNSSIYFKECDQVSDYDGKEPFCRKTDVTILKNEHRVVRGCGWKKHHLHCYNVDEASYSERVCQCYYDGCNPATLPLPATFLLAMTVAFTLGKATL